MVAAGHAAVVRRQDTQHARTEDDAEHECDGRLAQMQPVADEGGEEGISDEEDGEDEVGEVGRGWFELIPHCRWWQPCGRRASASAQPCPGCYGIARLALHVCIVQAARHVHKVSCSELLVDAAWQRRMTMAMASAMTSLVVSPASLLPSQRAVAPSRGAKAPISVVPRGQPTAGTSRSDLARRVALRTSVGGIDDSTVMIMLEKWRVGRSWSRASGGTWPTAHPSASNAGPHREPVRDDAVTIAFRSRQAGIALLSGCPHQSRMQRLRLAATCVRPLSHSFACEKPISKQL